MNVNVRFFALYRERIGKDTAGFEIAEGSNVVNLVDVVMRDHPDLCPNPSELVVAVNQEYVSHNHQLKEGDEVAFIPPVSGGAQ